MINDECITEQKHRPAWDHAFFMERAQGQERERAPRIEPTRVDLPPSSYEIDMERCLKAWRAIGFINNATWIRESWARIRRWGQRR